MPFKGERMPALFVGHGSPMNAIEDNRWSRALRELARLLPRPRSVLAVSAHWFVEGTSVTANPHPPTIHDFGGFPRALHEMEYPAPGDPALAERVRSLLGADRVALDEGRGLDHGVWSVLIHLFPRADVPVVQLALDQRLTPEEHFELARPLRNLRDDGVLLLASGNVTHNLGHAMRRHAEGDDSTPEWAARFDEAVKRACAERDGEALPRLLETEDGRMAQPSPDHYLPILYVAAAADEGDEASFPIEGFDWGSLSMRSVLFRSQANRRP
jgi:4,5-DOPA dioxygenase extradiol